jgi:hypothetical protein
VKYLTLGSCLKGEESYMMDFVKYHRSIGVEHFVFLDRTYDALYSLLGGEPDVEIIHFPEGPDGIHQDAWKKLIIHNKGKTKWLALIDADQCLVPAQTNDVREVLKNYEEFACLQCNWKAFGSSFHETREPGSVYERFLLTSLDDSEYNYHTQFICQPDRTRGERTPEPHYPLLNEGEFSVNTNKEPIDPNKIVALNPSRPLSFNTPPLHDVLWVAHYTNKSKEEWMIKNSKGRADIFGMKMPLEQFDQYESMCNVRREERVLELWKAANGIK